MILRELTLKNFCLYRGEHVLDLAPVKRRGRTSPIILFGGMNGGGKTTLLDAIQLVLYGKRARCSKRGDKPYEQFLRESVNHSIDLTEGAAVTLSFQYHSEGEDHIYEICRSWSGNETVRERVQVSRDGEPDAWLSENWNQLVDEMIPIGIAQLCFFDAEKIRSLAEEETSTQALGDAIKSLLGLDLAERLLADTSVLESRIAKRAQKTPELEQLERLEGELSGKQAEISRLVQEQGSLENPRLAARRRVQEAEEKFARSGGKHWERREERQRKRGELESSVRETEERLAALAATELPMALASDLLKGIAEQADRERQSSDAEIIVRLFAARDQKLLAMLKRDKVSDSTVKDVRKFLDSDRKRHTNQSGTEQWLELSDNGRRQLAHLLERGLNDCVGEATSLLEKFESSQHELDNVQRSLAAAPKEDSIRDIAVELKAAISELAVADQQANRLEKELAGLRFERDELAKQIKKLRRKVVDEQIGTGEQNRIKNLLIRTNDTMREFLKRTTAAKIGRLSHLVTESFRFLLRKKSLVERVLIDPESFAVSLRDHSGQVVPKDRLSEGEKQIFAVSILWGLSQAAARPLPAIIDTPMARLDADHRLKLVDRYFPNASHQVIVLSTDTEIERHFFHALLPHISRAYRLRYDEQSRETRPEEGYFWEPEISVGVPA
jgi:DNA sulfur modification protein DndD